MWLLTRKRRLHFHVVLLVDPLGIGRGADARTSRGVLFLHVVGKVDTVTGRSQALNSAISQDRTKHVGM